MEKIMKSAVARKVSFVVGVILLIVGMIIYFKIFYTKGIIFDDAFLKKEVNSTGVQYTGKNKYGKLRIVLEGIKDKSSSADVIYWLPNNMYRKYTVEYVDNGNWDKGIKTIKDIYGYVVFEGSYHKGSNFLLDKDGSPVFDIPNITFNGSLYTNEYEIPLLQVASIACNSYETIRGKYIFLILAVILLLITAIDIKFPLFFFLLHNSLSVRNPEPSDFYLQLQKTSWIVIPVIAFVMLIVAVIYV